MTPTFRATAVLAALLCASAAHAEIELSIYSGIQGAPESEVSGDYPVSGAAYSGDIGWEGRSGEMPPYYGVRGTWWQTDRLGYGLEFTHTKVYAPDDEAAALGFDGFELTDGNNILTVNALYRWPDQFFGTVTPYFGAGVGITFPHVDVDGPFGADTYEFQITGPAARAFMGASYDVTDRVAVFGEYQFTYSSHEGDLDEGGTYETDIETNALNIGLSLKF